MSCIMCGELQVANLRGVGWLYPAFLLPVSFVESLAICWIFIMLIACSLSPPVFLCSKDISISHFRDFDFSQHDD